MTRAEIIVLSIVLFAGLFHLAAAFCGLWFRVRRKADFNGIKWPHIACYKPLCGDDHELLLNLTSFLKQDYPDYTVIFGTAEKTDCAYEVANSLCTTGDHNCAKTVCGENPNGSNRKVRNLKNMHRHLPSSAEFIVISDSDIRVTEDYLKHLIAPFYHDPSVGAVTTIYKVENTPTLGGLLESLSVEFGFVPGVLVAATFSKLKYAFGASIAVKKEDFLKAGGFSHIEDYLADDYQIGKIIHNLGKKVVLSSYVVSIINPKRSMLSSYQHLARWYRTVRVCAPFGYLFLLFTNAGFWALLGFLLSGATATGWLILLGSCTNRIACSTIVALSIGSTKGLIRSLLTPLWDIAATFFWLVGMCGNEVTWRGVKYRVLSDGRLAEVK